MYPSVKAAFRAFNEPFEGVVPWMYLDIKGLVTVGVGNLIDPVELAVQLPFRFRARPEVAASPEQIAEEWHQIKSNAALAKAGYRACEPLTRLRLNDAAIDALIASRLTGNEASLKKKESFRQFGAWPADAQLGLLSMAWALGPGGVAGFSRLAAACRKLDFAGAAANCTINEQGNPGVAPRNRADRTLFQNAAVVRAGGAGTSNDPMQLHYPAVLAGGQPAAG
ncbi:MAG: hypothetical protein ABSH47_22555 [Bryobacteraceae bacterium]